MRLTIITINFNGSESTINLLRSLKGQIDKDFEIIVVDNASEESDFNKLKEGAGGVFILRNDKNLGFSGGNNVGIRKAIENRSNWVLLLNNDTWVERSFISSLKAKLEPLTGIVGLPLVEDDSTAYFGQIAWLKPTLAHVYSPMYTGHLRRNRSYYAIGGAMAIHRDVFRKIGYLDEKYFLYFEDADFAIKAIKEATALNFLDEPKAYHHVSATAKKLGSPMLLRYHYRNALYFNFKNGPWYIKVIIWPWSFWVIKKQLFKIIIQYKADQSIAILKGVFDFYNGKMGKIDSHDKNRN